MCVLQERVPVAANLLSYHLKVLRDAGLVTTSRRGRWIDYSLADGASRRLAEALPVGEAAASPMSITTHLPTTRTGRGVTLAGVAGLWALAYWVERVALGRRAPRRARHVRRRAADRDAALLLLRHGQDRPAAVRDHLRDHDPALLHEHRAHPGAARRAARRCRQRHGRRAGRGHPVLLVQCGARLHRLRRGRGAAGRDAELPDRQPAGQRDRDRPAADPVRLAGHAGLRRRRRVHRDRRGLGARAPEARALRRAVRLRDDARRSGRRLHRRAHLQPAGPDGHRGGRHHPAQDLALPARRHRSRCGHPRLGARGLLHPVRRRRAAPSGCWSRC